MGVIREDMKDEIYDTTLGLRSFVRADQPSGSGQSFGEVEDRAD